MSIEKQPLGKAIQQVRMARGLTQAELAEVAGLAKGGKSVALIEQGKRFVSVDTLNALANGLDIPPACLAILGSRNIGKNKAATDFMKNLQKLISAVVLAEAELQAPTRAMSVRGERKQLAELARVFEGLSNRRRPQATKAKPAVAAK